MKRFFGISVVAMSLALQANSAMGFQLESSAPVARQPIYTAQAPVSPNPLARRSLPMAGAGMPQMKRANGPQSSPAAPPPSRANLANGSLVPTYRPIATAALASTHARRPYSDSNLAYSSPSGGSHHHHNGCNCQSHNRVYQPIFQSSVLGEEANLHCESEACGPSQVMGMPVAPQYSDPQEYIFDGGDQSPEVYFDRELRPAGLQAEDTVLYYETVDGKSQVEAACRTAIYSPRFAAVRKVVRMETEDRSVSLQATLNPESVLSVDENVPTLALRKQVQPHSDESLNLIEAFRKNDRGVPIEHTLPAIAISDAFMPYEDIQLIRNGERELVDYFKLQRSAAAALAWSNYENVALTIDGKAAEVARSQDRMQETVVYEIDGKPRVRICKVASHQIAHSGDEIFFTIRFDNIGDQVVGNLVVVDSLPPRLEYVAGSQQASVATKFSTEPNETGSELLRWDIDPIVEPGDGGVIRFRCRVR